MKKIELVEIRQVNDALAEMVALFRVELRSYKGIASKLNAPHCMARQKKLQLLMETIRFTTMSIPITTG